MDKGKFFALLHVIAPLIISSWPDKRVQRVGSAVINGMGEAEQIFHAGEGESNKKPFVLAGVGVAAKSVNDALGKEVVPVEATVAASGSVIDTIASVIKVIDTAHANAEAAGAAEGVLLPVPAAGPVAVPDSPVAESQG